MQQIGITQLTDLQKRRRGRKLTHAHRDTAGRPFLPRHTSTALAATRAIKFGKLVDGLGPLANITAISKRENVRWVMKAGPVVVDKTRETERAH
jgi:hypothetical protein